MQEALAFFSFLMFFFLFLFFYTFDLKRPNGKGAISQRMVLDLAAAARRHCDAAPHTHAHTYKTKKLDVLGGRRAVDFLIFIFCVYIEM